MTRIAADYLSEGADTYRERHKVYGNNYLKVGAVMTALFPEGIELTTEDDHNRFHILMLKIVKITRYVQNWSKGGHEDSLLDDMVYGAMLLEIDNGIKDRIAEEAEDAAERAMVADLFGGSRETFEAVAGRNVRHGDVVAIRALNDEELESLYRLSGSSRPIGIIVDRIEDTLDATEAGRLADDGCPNAEGAGREELRLEEERFTHNTGL